MKTREFVYRTHYPHAAKTVFDWFTRKHAFERLAPPWQNVELVSREGGIDAGRLHMRMHAGPFSQDWIARHGEYDEGRSFMDIQERGPFTHWKHVHRVRRIDDHSCELEDHITYAVSRFEPINRLLDRWIRRQLTQLFRYRHRVLQNDLSCYAAHSIPAEWTIRVGPLDHPYAQATKVFLSNGGHKVEEAHHLAEGGDCDALIWFGVPTHLEFEPRIAVFVSPELGTLPETQVERLVAVRHGIVLSPQFGILKKLLPYFRCGLGGTLGSWNQRLTWVAVDDLLYNLYALLASEKASGLVDVASPQFVPAELFSTTLAYVLRRPILFPWPHWLRERLLGKDGITEVDDNAHLQVPAFQGQEPTYCFVDLEKTLRYYLGKE